MLVCYSYLRQVLNETLRWAVISPYTGRVQDVDTVLDGHVIPAAVISLPVIIISGSIFYCLIVCFLSRELLRVVQLWVLCRVLHFFRC